MVPKFVLKIIKSTVMKDVKRRRKLYPPHGLYNEKLHIPYIDDGGAYMFCDHMDNYYIATKMLEKGFDFFTPDYEPNNGKRDTFDLVADTIKCLNHFFEHLTDYDLQDDSFFLMDHRDKPCCILPLSDLSHLRSQRCPRLCIIF